MRGVASRAWAGSSIGLALVFAAYFLPHVVSVLLLVFAGAVLGVVLDAIAATIQRRVPVGHRFGRWAGLLGMVIAVALAFAAAGMIVVPQLLEQGPILANRLPEALASVRDRMDEYELLRPISGAIGNPASWVQGGLLARATGLLSGTFDVLFNLFVIAFIGFFLAVNPEAYRRVALYPLSGEQERRARRVTTELGRELRLWAIGRVSSMAIVGLATGTGLWVLGLNLAFTLGLLAGVLAIVPYLGPVLALVPILLIAIADPAVSAGSILLLYGAIQILESNLVTPLIQQRAVAIPPALLIATQLLGGVFGGMLGILLAAPMVVVFATGMRQLHDPDEQQAEA